MSGWLIFIVTLIYLGVAIDQYIQGNTGMFIVYVGYAIANVGFLMMLVRF